MEQAFPKVTKEHIESLIVAEYWGTGQSMFAQAPMLPSVKTLTVYVLVLKNGCTVTGTSNCVHPGNFDAEIGRKVARENAFAQIWQLEGYALRNKLTED